MFKFYNLRIRLRAMTDLEADQQLHHSYTFTLNGTAQRQEHLRTGKFFTCECQRCKDPTELGTNFSTFKCTKCEDGWVLTANPLGALNNSMERIEAKQLNIIIFIFQ